MMFVIRSTGARPEAADIAIKLARPTPDIVPDATGKTDFFCVGEAAAMAALRDAGWTLVELRDGYYDDGKGGGIAIWGQGKYWEIRDTPFTVAEACGPASETTSPAADGDVVNVRRAVFGA